MVELLFYTLQSYCILPLSQVGLFSMLKNMFVPGIIWKGGSHHQRLFLPQQKMTSAAIGNSNNRYFHHKFFTKSSLKLLTLAVNNKIN
jgi:hypothetical protein